VLPSSYRNLVAKLLSDITIMAANLLTLPGDVVLNILRYCGISDVLPGVIIICLRSPQISFTRIPLDMQTLALACVHETCLHGASSRFSVAPRPVIRITSSSEELVDLAKRIAQGPQSWSHLHSSGPLIMIARQKVLHVHAEVSLREGRGERTTTVERKAVQVCEAVFPVIWRLSLTAARSESQYSLGSLFEVSTV
jgi:hypothetical protein